MFHRYFKILITSTWLFLLGVLFTRTMFIPSLGSSESVLLEQARQERFFGIWFQEKRIGYVSEVLQPGEHGYSLDQEAHLLLNVLETTQPIDMHVQAELSRELFLKNFSFKFTSPFYTMAARGKVQDNQVRFTLDTGQSTITDTVTLSGPPLLAVNDRSYLLARLQKEGQKIKVPSFDPVSLSGRESIITFHGRERQVVRGRLKNLYSFTEQTGGIRINFWLDEDGRIVKETSPAGFVFIAEPEFRAKDILDTGSELLSAVAVPRKGPLPPEEAQVVRYKLSYPQDLDLMLAGGRQNLNGDILTVFREDFPQDSQAVPGGTCGGQQFLQPSRYVQAGHPQITALAASIVGEATEPARQVRLLAEWVFENIEKRPVIGLPDALTTLKNRTGDCNEHASLFAALARSRGINTAIAAGVTLQKDSFYYHAWNEVCLGGTWYSLDTTTNQLPADLFHIRFGRGDMEEQLQIGGLLGNLHIEILPE